MRLANKVAIVTGAGAGIGRAISELFALEGASVVIATRVTDEGETVAKSISRSGGKALFVPCDVSVETSVQVLMQRVREAFGRVDILVNNAGVNFAKPFESVSAEDWDRVMAVDLRGTFLCSRCAVPMMLAQGGGSIVNIASVHAHACIPTASAYDAAKWGIIGLTKALAVEFAARNIRVNAVSPGLIATKIWNDILAAAESHEAALVYWKSNIPMGRLGSSAEVAKVVLFLASDDASYVTGADYVVDGGMTSLLVSIPPHASKSLEGR